MARNYAGYDMARALEQFASRQGFEAPTAFYIVGSFNLRDADGKSVYSDEAHLWCEGCAENLLAEAKELMSEKAFDDAGHMVCPTDAIGEDTCPHCMKCGETLDGSVSEYCVEEEVAHYLEHPIDPGDPINPRQAVEIAMILSAAPNDKEVLKIGGAALREIKRMEGVS
jgi:hypothetical protein